MIESSVKVLQPILFDSMGLFTQDVYQQIIDGNDELVDMLLVAHFLERKSNESKQISKQIQKRS